MTGPWQPDPLWVELCRRFEQPHHVPEELLTRLGPVEADVLRRRNPLRPGGKETRKAIATRLGTTTEKVARLEHDARYQLTRLAYERERNSRRCPHCGGTGVSP